MSDTRQSQSKQTKVPSTNSSGAIVPSVSLPRGGGAIRGIGEKFGTNLSNGTGSLTVPIVISAGRSGFQPELTLSYDSGTGNSPFGFGWGLSLSQITRKTEKGIPLYRDADESDVFTLTSAEDLVPVLVQNSNGKWTRQNLSVRIVNGLAYQIRQYRPRIEGLFARIERWTNTTDATDVFWRSISKDNITTWYGKTSESRIADPANPSHVFSWLICQSHDDKGNVIVYRYKCEDSERIFENIDGDPIVKPNERNRTIATRSAQRYIKCIRYGNCVPYFPELKVDDEWPEPVDAYVTDGSNTWHFEVVFDYGEHSAKVPMPSITSKWPARVDPFSSYRAGFEVRTYRTCQRVLMFHNFPDETDVKRNYLVRSTNFDYSVAPSPTETSSPAYTVLARVTQTGYRRSTGGYKSRSLPAIEFEYIKPVVQDSVEEVASADFENLPIGLDGNTYRWTDLHGEGISGILTEQVGEWYYKRNLSPIPVRHPDGGEKVEARFAPLETVSSKPNITLNNGAEFMDLAGDGLPDLVMINGATPGLYEHDNADGWQPFRPFAFRLNLDLRDSNLKFVDLDGDGHADVLISENDAFVWHASLAERGFSSAQRVMHALNEESGPRIVFNDGTQSIYLADLSGDGLTDIVRIRNGEVCYWPNLGYAHFGAKVTMDNAPWFDRPDQFNHERIRLADIDGTGTTDIIYLHGDGVRLYFNQSGNSWSEPHQLNVFPDIHDLVSIIAIDLLGNGTACLVWSSPLPGDNQQPMRYVNLMGGQKPHLLFKVINNLGAETEINYAPSTKFYLQDKRDGKPWITRLPFPVHVVEKVTTYDYISRNRFVTRYTYHHGYFDGEEREFRGFGMVEQTDSEQFGALRDGEVPVANISLETHVPPVYTKTWFHTGVYIGRNHISDYFAGLLNPTDKGEYFRELGLTDTDVRAMLLQDTALPEGLALEEEREACRALKGSILRQEMYADDARQGTTIEWIQRANTPYTVTEQNFTIRLIQSRGPNRHAVFLVHPQEKISYQYERNPSDPRIQHVLTLEVDTYGNILKQADISYGRRQTIRIRDNHENIQTILNPELNKLDSADRVKQTTTLITYTQNCFTVPSEYSVSQQLSVAIDEDDTYRTPLLYESRTFELTGYTPTGNSGRFQASDLVNKPDAKGRTRHKFEDDISYESTSTGNLCRRTIEWVRTLYRRNDLNGLLPLGQLDSLALPGETYKLAFTPGLLNKIYQRPRLDQKDESLLPDPAAVLGRAGDNLGGFVDLDSNGSWWIPSGRSLFHPKDLTAQLELTEARKHFFLLRRFRDPFGYDTLIDYDPYDLLIAETCDALGNRVTVDKNDYRVLQPRLISDPNRNRTEVAFDTLGMVVATAVMGKPLSAPIEGDSLAGLATDLNQTEFDAIFDWPDPHAAAPSLLRDATTRIIYDLDRFASSRKAYPNNPTLWQPTCTATLARETHASDAAPPHGLKFQLSFSYSDGFGREIQKKIQAEPGQVTRDGPIISPRWVGSGWTIFNNKGKPVRQYQPFFSTTRQFEFALAVGVSSVLFYDPAGRIVATLHPNHTYEKVVFDPWQQTTYDVNDTCASRNRETGDPRTDPDIGGYLFEYFKGHLKPWDTWRAKRIDGAMGQHEKDAAERAGAHSDTPTTIHFDALGRPFLTVTRNRTICADHDLHDTEDSFANRIELDIEGNQREVRDERKLPIGYLPHGAREQRIVMCYAYDMLGNRIYQFSMEAGARWKLNDVAGKPIRAWDSRGHNFTTKYDALRRPIEQTVRGTFRDDDPLKPNSDPRTLNSNDILVEKLQYGEPRTPAEEAEAQRLNLRTRIYRHFDSAGIITHGGWNPMTRHDEAYDFKGNLLRSTRQLVSSYTDIPDWSQNPTLDVETFEGSTRYDAFNRPVQAIVPHSSLIQLKHSNKFNVIQPVFNEANLLERIDVWLERAAEPSGLLDPATEAPSPVGVANINYDAKGQRTLIDYKTKDVTVIRTTYTYDRETFRLTHLYTRRGVHPATSQGVAFTDDCKNFTAQPKTIAAPAQPIEGTTCGLQNLHYTYDPVGNITHIRDDAQQAIYFRNKRVEPSSEYIYDAFYRLIEATGREHLGQNGGAPLSHSHDDAARIGLPHRGDGKAMGRYVERFVYDAVGNFLQMQHQRTDRKQRGWKRVYDYFEASLIENDKDDSAIKFSNRLTRTVLNPAGNNPQLENYLHDTHGNIVRMPHLGGKPGHNLHWDYNDRLRQTDQGGGGTTFYIYDASGQRVRKVWEKKAGLSEERIYLAGFEVFRLHSSTIGASTAVLERETLHIVDDKQRICMVETRTLDTGGNDQAPQQLIRYQFANHLGSASLELDEVAQIISYEEYAPYGSSTYQAVRKQTETAKRYRYTGKERDEETGFSYHGARHYIPWLGRWSACDPDDIREGINCYSYVSNNPVVKFDSNGKWETDMHFEAVYMTGRFAGATHKQSLIAAIASQSLDDSRKTDAVSLKALGLIGNPFRIPMSQPSLIQEGNNRHSLGLSMSESQVVADAGIKRKDILLFGLGMHTVGDFFPHANLTGNWTVGHQVGKNEDGSVSHFSKHDADYTHRNPIKALYTIQVFLKKWDQFLNKGAQTELGPDQWKAIDRFIRTERPDEKTKAFQEAMKSIGVSDQDLAEVNKFASRHERVEAMKRANALLSGKTSIELAEKLWRELKANDNFFNSEKTSIPNEYPLPPQPPPQEWDPLQDFSSWLESGVKKTYGIPY